MCNRSRDSEAMPPSPPPPPPPSATTKQVVATDVIPSSGGGGGGGVEPIALSVSPPITLKFVDVCYRVKLQGLEATGKAGGGLVKCCGRRDDLKQRSVVAVSEERTILNGVTGMVSPGEFVAVLGPSGSGKSTLLNVLGGRLQGKYTGSVLANGSRLTKPVLRKTGFVAQDDLLYPHLTVKETLVFCSLLRLPRTLSSSEKVSIAESVITELGLGKCQDTIIGNGFVRGVSGGERKRVSIGHEMLVNPSLLLLDEPTSGLDSTAAFRLVSTLVGLARKGKSVVASVHQPSSRVFQMFDSVLLLSEGSCLYFGKAREAMDYFASIGFSPRFHVNPVDFMLDLANGVAQAEGQGDMEKSNIRQTLAFSYNRFLAPKVRACVEDVTNSVLPADTALATTDRREGRNIKKDYSSVSWFSQFSVLLRRSLKERRHEAFNSLRVFQVITTAVLAGAMWWRSDIKDVPDRLGLLFFTSIFWGVLASFNAVFTFPQERAIFIKERASGMYTLSSYFVARMAGDLPMELILPTAFTVITYWMAGLKPDAGAFVMTLAVLLGYVLVAQGLGLLIGAAVMDAKRASTLVTIIMLAFLLTGGFYVQKIPSCLAWTKYISCTFYSYRLLIMVQYGGKEKALLLSSFQPRAGQRQKQSSNDTETMGGGGLEGQVSSTMCVAALIVMFVGFRLMAYIALRRIKA